MIIRDYLRFKNQTPTLTRIIYEGMTNRCSQLDKPYLRYWRNFVYEQLLNEVLLAV